MPHSASWNTFSIWKRTIDFILPSKAFNLETRLRQYNVSWSLFSDSVSLIALLISSFRLFDNCSSMLDGLLNFDHVRFLVLGVEPLCFFLGGWGVQGSLWISSGISISSVIFIEQFSLSSSLLFSRSSSLSNILTSLEGESRPSSTFTLMFVEVSRCLMYAISKRKYSNSGLMLSSLAWPYFPF